MPLPDIHIGGCYRYKHGPSTREVIGSWWEPYGQMVNWRDEHGDDCYCRLDVLARQITHEVERPHDWPHPVSTHPTKSDRNASAGE